MSNEHIEAVARQLYGFVIGPKDPEWDELDEANKDEGRRAAIIAIRTAFERLREPSREQFDAAFDACRADPDASMKEMHEMIFLAMLTQAEKEWLE